MQEKGKKKAKAKIGHSLEELEDGLILTLQDKPILQDGGINEEDDIFENYEKRRQNESEHNRELREKLKTVASAATSHIEAKNQGLKSLLPHYDDYRYKNDEVDLEDGTVIKRSRPKAPARTPSDFEVSNCQNPNSEYYKRPSKSAIRARNLEKSRGNSSGELLAFLNETALEKNHDEDQQALKSSASDIIDESLNTVRKRRKAEQEMSEGAGSSIIVSEEEELLARAIQRTRQKQERQKVSVLDLIKEEGGQEEDEGNCEEIELKPVSFTGKKPGQVNKNMSITDAAKGTTSCLFVNLPSEKLEKREEPLPESLKEISPEELEKMRQQLQFLEDQKLGIGLADTLSFLRENKLLHNQEQFGRANDELATYNKPEDRVKLEYRNASGQLMKPKEAFRYMSAIFHGQGPGKNKIEKIKKKELMEVKIKEAANSQSRLMGLLEKHQTKTGDAHMVLDYGTKLKKPKQ